ncbi:DUF2971 domain-containing protein [Aeromonas veronii]|uniref:DUF2971 domain-containing protein n=1 Tax=Aeromonas veronii TaxID=654 RepID=UPI00355B6E85
MYLLSQWRGYSNKMGGYSIIFYFDSIESIAKRNDFELVKCIYDEGQHLNKVESVINEIIDMVGQSSPHGINGKNIDYFEEALLKLAPV